MYNDRLPIDVERTMSADPDVVWDMADEGHDRKAEREMKHGVPAGNNVRPRGARGKGKGEADETRAG